MSKIVFLIVPNCIIEYCNLASVNASDHIENISLMFAFLWLVGFYEVQVPSLVQVNA